MGIRSDQHMGLTEAARKITENRDVAYVEKTTRVYPDGSQEDLLDKEVLTKPGVYDTYKGMFDEEYDLFEYRLKNGRIVREYVQAEPWSSGPVFFLALLDKETGEVVPESRWSKEEIDHC